MTKEEAKQAMREGKKVTHVYFDDNEWMTMQGDNVLTEEGYLHDADEFWSYRTAKCFDDSYSIYGAKYK